MEIIAMVGLIGAGIKPAISFCGAVPWWKWCRAPYRKVAKIYSRVPK